MSTVTRRTISGEGSPDLHFRPLFKGGEFAPGYGGALGMVGGVKLAVGSFVIWDSGTSKYKCRDRYYP